MVLLVYVFLCVDGGWNKGGICKRYGDPACSPGFVFTQFVVLNLLTFEEAGNTVPMTCPIHFAMTPPMTS